MPSDNGYRHVVIWVNHRKAVFAVFVGSLPSNWMEIYGEGPHPQCIGGWLLYSVEAHRHESMKGFHDEIMRHLTPADAILLLGPGQPKHRLARHMTQQGSHLGKIVHLDTVADLTEAELVAFAAAFFEADNDRGTPDCRSEQGSLSD
jgi:hypothetical protein